MPVLHLLMLCRRGLALVLVLLMAAASICPQGWFVCLADDAATPALVGIDHVSGHACDSEHHCDSCPDDHDRGCQDLALSLIDDLQTHQSPDAPVLPAGALLAVLPPLARNFQVYCAAPSAWISASPPTPLSRHVSLQV